MTQKELLYLEDVLNQQKYFMQHLLNSSELLEDEALVKKVDKYMKKADSLYKMFYQILEEVDNG